MNISDSVLLAYLDDALSEEKIAQIEQAIRADADLRLRIEALVAQRDSGMHSLGDIWRRHRLSCPTREQLGSYLLEAMLQDSSDYLRFHIEVIGCRYCRANLADLQLAQDQAKQSEATVAQRRKRIFQSSVGRMRTFPEDN
ncbi:MAG: hypothetical protein LW720_10250 [Pirellula sp.]|jgi:hypothetical protein|nr:hypothetical protein [Pirellula sp.]